MGQGCKFISKKQLLAERKKNGEGNDSILAGEAHGQRSLEGYSQWGCKESDATEHAGRKEKKKCSV